MYKDKRITHLVAVGANNEIGANNALLWNIPEDMKFFRDTTLGHICIAGRKTVESFQKPLSRRVTLCVSNTIKESSEKHALNSMKLSLAMSAARWQSDQLKTDKIFIIGGGQLYRATEPYVDELLITQIDKEYPEADTFYNIPEGFEMVYKSSWSTSVKGEKYRFTKWQRLPF